MPGTFTLGGTLPAVGRGLPGHRWPGWCPYEWPRTGVDCRLWPVLNLLACPRLFAVDHWLGQAVWERKLWPSSGPSP